MAKKKAKKTKTITERLAGKFDKTYKTPQQRKNSGDKGKK